MFLDDVTTRRFDDAPTILTGRPTGATEYFKEKTSEKLTAACESVLAHTMHEVGVARPYKGLMGHTQTILFLKGEPFDLDRQSRPAPS
jgi:hypothetical protein